MGIIGAIFILLMIDLVCVLIKMSFNKLDEVFSGTSNTGSSTNEPVTWEAMGRAKCQCLACNEMVYIPTQYLERKYGVQNSKCPNCGWKMTKVKIVQTWGIE